MKTRLSTWARFALPALIVGSLAVACGDDDEATGVTTADLAGDWTATSFVLSNNAFLPADPIDMVSVGVAVEMSVAASGAFTFSTTGLGTATGGALDDLSVTGTIVVTGNNTAVITTTDDPDDPSDATFTLSGDNLTLSIPDAALIDFDDSGTIVEAEWVDIVGAMTRG